MGISAKLVKALRDKTGAGMMDCKKALVACDGDIDKALEYLQIKGLAAVQKRAGREASEGLVVVKYSEDRHFAVMLEVNCETDFVSRNKDFRKFVETLAQHIFEAKPKYLDQSQAPADANPEAIFMNQTLINSDKKVKDFVVENTSVIGENVVVRRFTTYEVEKYGYIGGYVHHDGKTGALIELELTEGEDQSAEAVADLAKKLSMHITASKPIYLDKSEISEEVLASKRAIFEAKAKEMGKPEKIAVKIAGGYLNNWIKEVCLVDQEYVFDSHLKVNQAVQAVSKQLKGSVKIRRFDLFSVTQKKED